MASSSSPKVREQHNPATIFSRNTRLDLLNRSILASHTSSRTAAVAAATSTSNPTSTTTQLKNRRHRRHSQGVWQDIDSPSPSTSAISLDPNQPFTPNMKWRDLLPRPSTSTRDEIFELIFATLFSAVAVIALSLLIAGGIQVGFAMMVVVLHAGGLAAVYYYYTGYQSRGPVGGEQEADGTRTPASAGSSSAGSASFDFVQRWEAGSGAVGRR